MIFNTFLHIPRVGKAFESKLWSTGIRTWNDVSRIPARILSEQRRGTFLKTIEESHHQVESGNSLYFQHSLPADQCWRIFPEYRSSMAYIDIETTCGRYSFEPQISTIVLYDGSSVRHYVQGMNLRAFKDDIFDYKTIVTYNGKCFDIPIIEQYFQITLTQAQIDLRYVMKRLGYSGGLKAIERSLGIDRGGLSELDGLFAVYLWHEYEREGSDKALETLLAYNAEDAINLETLLVVAYNLNLESTPFARSHKVQLPAKPQSFFHPDAETIAGIRNRISVVPHQHW